MGSAGVIIPPLGESAIFSAGLRGYTVFHMLNLGAGDALAELSWLGDQGPQQVRMIINQPRGVETYRDQFMGAKVTVTNLSQRSSVQVRVTLRP